MLSYNEHDSSVMLIRKSHVDHKHEKKTHGQMQSENAKELRSYFQELTDPTDEKVVLVREKGFFKFPAETQVLCKVVGVTDLYAWAFGHREFAEIAPSAVKKLVTGKASANKEEVAAALESYVGKQEYACDDESDAVAVGIAWLISCGFIEAKSIEAE